MIFFKLERYKVTIELFKHVQNIQLMCFANVDDENWIYDDASINIMKLSAMMSLVTCLRLHSSNCTDGNDGGKKNNDYDAALSDLYAALSEHCKVPPELKSRATLSKEQISLLQYARICRLVIDNWETHEDVERFEKLLIEYSSDPRFVTSTFFKTLYDEMYGKKTTMMQDDVKSGNTSSTNLNCIYEQILVIILERHLQFELMNESGNKQPSSLDNDDGSSHITNDIDMEIISFLLRTLINLNSHQVDKQREWIQQAVQVVQNCKTENSVVAYPKDEANFIVAKCWNIGVVVASKNVHLHRAFDTATSDDNSNTKMIVDDEEETTLYDACRDSSVEDGIWYFKTAIAFAKLCDLPYEYLTDMYNQLIAREDSVDKGNNLKGNSTSSIMSEANSILEP